MYVLLLYTDRSDLDAVDSVYPSADVIILIDCDQ